MTEDGMVPTSSSNSNAERRTQPRPHDTPATLLSWTLAAIIAVGLAAGGCSDDDDDDDNANETLQAEFQELANFANSLDDGPAPQIIAHPEVESLFSAIGFSLRPPRGIEGSPLSERAPWKMPDARDSHSEPILSQVADRLLAGAFGTYERDTTSVVEPFPGWVFVAPTPADGLVFHFSEDDDFVVIENGVERHISGEIRFLQLAFGKTSQGGVVTNVVWELQIDPLSIPIVHVPFAGVPDFETGAYDRVEFGDADELGNLANCYFGLLAFDILNDATDPADQHIVLFAADTSQNPDYAVHLDAELHDVLKGNDEAHLHFGFGNSGDVTVPETAIDALLDNFRPDTNTDEVIADVAGTITHQGRLVATFEGSTDQVPVDFDVNGDGHVDAKDICIDIRITFTGGDPMSICQAFAGVEVRPLPFTGAPLVDLR